MPNSDNVTTSPPTTIRRTNRTAQETAPAANPDDPDFYLGQIDAWLTLERAGGETIVRGMEQSAFEEGGKSSRHRRSG